jgi:starch synthase (maltosyl-transferring)
MPLRPFSVVIENVGPLVNGGRYPIKRLAGERVAVWGDVFKDGHDVLSAVLKWRKVGAKQWNEVAMDCADPWTKDHWRGEFTVTETGANEWTIEAWGDLWKSWQHEWHAKYDAKQADLQSETLEGAGFVESAGRLAAQRKAKADAEKLQAFAREMKAAQPERVNALANDGELAALMWAHADRSLGTEFVCTFAEAAEIFPEKNNAVAKYPRVWVDRERAGFAAWYEFFPRSAEGNGDRGSKFRDCLPRVEYARAMGFDTIYFPPIHPVGVTARKGRNNSLNCQPGEPGVPYAIGNRHQNCPNGGGHRDVAPELGTLEDFDWLVAEIRKRGMEVALDFAINCSPDHPYVHEHPEWFFKRPDGTIKYAENPPKKYQDVYPMDYHCATWRELWSELAGVIEFWCEHGVRVFRVDNPHTKPVMFWDYLIARVQARFPDAIFLSEAFTRPKMMRVLAKAGFTQSYTYFTWRNTARGLREYFNDLAHSESADYMRPNLWPNTPDILPSYLQFGGKPAFLVRALLAATLAPVYGIYSGFELCENAGLEKKPWDAAGNVRGFLELCDGDYKQLAREEYLDSEKYQFKQRDWSQPGIRDFIGKLNRIRRDHAALRQFRNLQFQDTGNDLLLAYSKSVPGNHLLIVVNLNAWHAEQAMVQVPLEEFRLGDGEEYEVEDLLTGERYRWRGRRNFVRLVPGEKAGHVLRLVHPVRT